MYDTFPYQKLVCSCVSYMILGSCVTILDTYKCVYCYSEQEYLQDKVYYAIILTKNKCFSDHFTIFSFFSKHR